MPLQATPPASSTAAQTEAARQETRHATIGELAIAAGIAREAADGSIVFERQEPPPDATLQREAIASTATSTPSTATQSTAATVAAGSRTIAVSREPTGSATSRSGSGDNDATGMVNPEIRQQQDLDDLARKLFPRFRRMMSSEVRWTMGRLGDPAWNRH